MRQKFTIKNQRAKWLLTIALNILFTSFSTTSYAIPEGYNKIFVSEDCSVENDVMDKMDENNEGIIEKGRDSNTNDMQRTNRGSVLQSLGDQQWIAISEQASVRLEEGRVLCEKVCYIIFIYIL